MNTTATKPSTKKWLKEQARQTARVERLAPGIWRVESTSHTHSYTVNLHTNSCNCLARAGCTHKDRARSEESAYEQTQQAEIALLVEEIGTERALMLLRRAAAPRTADPADYQDAPALRGYFGYDAGGAA